MVRILIAILILFGGNCLAFYGSKPVTTTTTTTTSVASPTALNKTAALANQTIGVTQSTAIAHENDPESSNASSSTQPIRSKRQNKPNEDSTLTGTDSSNNGDSPFGLVVQPSNDINANELAAQFIPKELKMFIARKYAAMMAARTTSQHPGGTNSVTPKPTPLATSPASATETISLQAIATDNTPTSDQSPAISIITDLTTTTDGSGLMSTITERDLVLEDDKPAASGPKIDCKVGWSKWSTCSLSCGKGIQIRTGTVFQVAANGGKACPTRLIQAEHCNTNTCPEPIPLDCTKLPNGINAWPTENCTHRFIMCSNGRAIRQNCPRTLFFNPKTKECDLWANTFECSGIEIQSTTTAATTTTTQQPTTTDHYLKPTFSCGLGMDNGLYADPNNNCSNHYFVCSNFVAIKLNCSFGLFFDEGSQSCSNFQLVYACTGVKSTTPLQTTAEELKDATSTESPVHCSSDDLTELPDPKNKCSNIWYTCAWGIVYKQSCPRGLYHYTGKGRCDHFENIEDCTGKKSTATVATSPTTPSTTTAGPTFDCNLAGDGLHQAGDCEPFYWTCNHGFAYKQYCPHGLRYDADENNCGFRTQIVGCNGTKPAGIAADANQPPEDLIDADSVKFSADEKCQNLEGGVMMTVDVQKGGCSKTFYVCQAGVASKFSCQGDMVFNPLTSVCAHRIDVAKCDEV